MSTQNSENYEPDESFNHQHTNEYRQLDVDVTIDTAEQSGEVIVRMELDKEEAGAVWEQISGNGHQYPEDVRTAVLEILGYNVQGATCRT